MFAFCLLLTLGANVDLDEGRMLHDSMQFRAAEARLRLARQQAQSPAERNEAIDLLARTLAAQGRLKDAEDLYSELLALDPHVEAPKDVAPKISDAFNRARESLYPKDFVRLLSSSPGKVTLVDPWRKVARTSTGVVLTPGVETAVDAPSIEVFDAQNKRLAAITLAVADRPVETKLTPPVVEPAPMVNSEPASVSRVPEWTLAATAVVSIAVGVGLAVSASSDSRAAGAAYWGSDTRALGERAQSKAIASNVLIGAGLAAGASAGLMWTFR